MQANKLDGWPSSSFLIFLICFQCSDKIFEEGDVSRDAFYEPEGSLDLISVTILR